MTEKIILDIRHSDDYTDYLFMTAGLTNRRIIPLIDASEDEIRKQSDCNTQVFRCRAILRPLQPGDPTVHLSRMYPDITVRKRAYLADDGSIDYAEADKVRYRIQAFVTEQLLNPENLRAVYRQYFPLFWRKRQDIYANPGLFFAPSRPAEDWTGTPLPLGAVLKAIDEDERKTFRLRLGGGCSCREQPVLVDYAHPFGEHWILHTWCPACHSRREIRAWHFERWQACEALIERAGKRFDKGQGLSTLSLFDVIDALTSA